MMELMMTKDNSRESHRSLMMFNGDSPIGGCSAAMVVLTGNHVVLLGVMTCVVVTTRVVVLVTGVAVVVVLLLRRLSLAVLLVLHSSVLEPYLDLTFCQIQIAGKFPPFLFGHVSVEQEFLFQF